MVPTVVVSVQQDMTDNKATQEKPASQQPETDCSGAPANVPPISFRFCANHNTNVPLLSLSLKLPFLLLCRREFYYVDPRCSKSCCLPLLLLLPDVVQGPS